MFLYSTCTTIVLVLANAFHFAFINSSFLEFLFKQYMLIFQCVYLFFNFAFVLVFKLAILVF